MKLTTAKQTTVVALLVLMLATLALFGEHPTRCQRAYLAGGQQVSFERFGQLHGDGVCAPTVQLANAVRPGR